MKSKADPTHPCKTGVGIKENPLNKKKEFEELFEN
jgi:hypothetical protein